MRYTVPLKHCGIEVFSDMLWDVSYLRDVARYVKPLRCGDIDLTSDILTLKCGKRCCEIDLTSEMLCDRSNLWDVVR